MMPTVVSIFSRSPAQLPVALAAALFLVSVLYMIGAVVVPETSGQLGEDI
jgi:hypothetical protein